MTVPRFRQGATIAIEDIRLQGALKRANVHFRVGRQDALAELPASEALRDHFSAIRQTTLAQLAHHLEVFEENAQAAGAIVHWARDAAEACQIIVDIAREHRVTLATKSKSMATEEVHLNRALEEAGVEPVETDLGEWIVQLAGEMPSHILAPAVHKTRQEIAELFSKEAGRPLPADDIPLLTAEARRMLRARFLEAGMGISGANIGVAETGSIVLVTNEGNGRMVTSTPPVHVALMGIEKIAPTWDDAAVWLALLARCATGQPLSIYTSVTTGPAREGDIDGPQEMHIVLLDNGRSQLVGTKYEEVLQCIRCSACLNICPVYRTTGGHAYGNPYSGPIGAVLVPLLFGLEENQALPQASTLCGACLDVCPARIDLPRMLLELRNDEVARRMVPLPERLAEQSAALALTDARLMRLATSAIRLGSRPLARDGSLRLPAPFNLGQQRDLPALAKKPFRDLWKDGQVGE
jgi:L-lactate dehydrogenase complex protein LldF